MNKLWSYISAALGGIILGVIIGVKFLAGDDISVEVKKIKNKRNSGSPTTEIPINITGKRERRQNKRKSKLKS